MCIFIKKNNLSTNAINYTMSVGDNMVISVILKIKINNRVQTSKLTLVDTKSEAQSLL